MENNRIIAYVVHDAVNCNEAYLDNYDSDVLKRADEQGLIFIAVHEDGTRERVGVDQVKCPVTTEEHTISFATPTYVDDRTEATIACFDAISTIINPEAATTSEDSESQSTESADPIKVFEEALKRLHNLYSESKSDEDEAGD